jgi:hypothetical protein
MTANASTTSGSKRSEIDQLCHDHWWHGWSSGVFTTVAVEIISALVAVFWWLLWR